jgi:hypothetical protein
LRSKKHEKNNPFCTCPEPEFVMAIDIYDEISNAIRSGDSRQVLPFEVHGHDHWQSQMCSKAQRIDFTIFSQKFT